MTIWKKSYIILLTMDLSSYKPSQAYDDIKGLIEKGEIQYVIGQIGCCNKKYLWFPNDDHKYIYNPDKLISKTLLNKTFLHIYIRCQAKL